MPTTITISEKYKKAQKKSIIWIALFLFTFLFSIVLSLFLFGITLYGSYLLIKTKIHLYTLLIGVGLSTATALIVSLNFKYLFSIFKKTEHDGIEIHQNDYPELFKLIYDTAKEVGTKKPKKVFLISDINASVYYSNHIQSLFFPTSKNLNIGIGLLQLTTVNELKGILAHEFGHFSQKSMTIGSYTANTHYVINEILNNKDSLDDFIRVVNEFNGLIGFFANGAIKYNKLFEKIYSYIFDQLVLEKLALSREMEFHADQIATNVVGIETMLKPMYRMELYISVLNQLTQFFIAKYEDEIYTENFYKNLDEIVKIYANQHDILIVDDLAQPTLKDVKKEDKRLIIEDIYATHPDLEDSVKNIEQTGIISEKDTSPLSKTLIQDCEKYEEEFTFQYFFNLGITRKNLLNDQEFLDLYHERTIENSYFPKEYHNIFNYYEFDLELIESKLNENNHLIIKPESVFNEENALRFETVKKLDDDLKLIDYLANQKIIQTYKFDNEIFELKDLNSTKEILKHDIDKAMNDLKDVIIDLNIFFAQNCDELEKNILANLKNLAKEAEEINHLGEEINIKTKFIFKTNHDKIIYEGVEVLHELNHKIKSYLAKYIDNQNVINNLHEEYLHRFQMYLNDDQYFYNGSYNEYEIELFFECYKFISEANPIITFSCKYDFLNAFTHLFEENKETFILDSEHA